MNSDPTISADLQSDRAVTPQRAWISLGGNMPWTGMTGAPLFEAALAVLAREGFCVTATSRLWTGPAWPDPADPPFFNAVAEGLWPGRPEELLVLLLKTETAFGRVRGKKNAPRTLDLDLLDMEMATGTFPGGLELPHPRLSERAFVLAPLNDAAPDWRDRISGAPARELLVRLENNRKFQVVGCQKLLFSANSGNP